MNGTFQKRRRAEAMLPVEEAQQRVLSEVRELGTESVDLLDALGRIIREEIRAPRDIPARDNSAMDGYAVHAADLSSASPEAPVVLKVVGDLPAGAVPRIAVERGTAVRIMTGAFVPEGADAVVQVELTDAGSSEVAVIGSVKAGANIRRRGEDMRAGEVVVAAGSVLRAGEIGVLAAAQRPRVEVARRPVVAILSTGDELVDVGEELTEGKIVNSNMYSLASLVRETGAIPRLIGTVKDSLEATVRAIEAAMDADFIVSSGGVSAGAYDYVKDALDSLGAETKFWQVAMKPGKPLVLARLRDRLYFGLPGNPVSSMVSFLLFVAPALRRAMGKHNDLFSPMVLARLAAPLRSKGDRRVYNRVRVVSRDGELVAYPMRAQGSGVSTSMLAANGLAILDVGVESASEGELIPTLLYGPIMSSPESPKS